MDRTYREYLVRGDRSGLVENWNVNKKKSEPDENAASTTILPSSAPRASLLNAAGIFRPITDFILRKIDGVRRWVELRSQADLCRKALSCYVAEAQKNTIEDDFDQSQYTNSRDKFLAAYCAFMRIASEDKKLKFNEKLAKMLSFPCHQGNVFLAEIKEQVSLSDDEKKSLFDWLCPVILRKIANLDFLQGVTAENMAQEFLSDMAQKIEVMKSSLEVESLPDNLKDLLKNHVIDRFGELDRSLEIKLREGLNKAIEKTRLKVEGDKVKFAKLLRRLDDADNEKEKAEHDGRPTRNFNQPVFPRKNLIEVAGIMEKSTNALAQRQSSMGIGSHQIRENRSLRRLAKRY